MLFFIQLCATAAGRTHLRDRNAYIILREYHKWEADKTNGQLALDLINILISEEPSPEFGTTNLKEIHVPENLEKQFNEQKIQNLQDEAE